MSRAKNERKTILVDKRLQARIVLSCSLPMIACLIFAIGVELLYRRQVAHGMGSPDGTILGMPEHRLGMLLLFISASMTQLVSTLLVSQKVAGTSYRIAQVLNAFREGDRTARVRLRKGDYQVRLADDLNGFLAWVEDPKANAAGANAPASGAAAATAGANALGPASSAPGARPAVRERANTERSAS